MFNFYTNDFLIGKLIVIYIFFLIFISDTTGYIFGKLFNNKKIFKLISPNKTFIGTLFIFIKGLFLYFILFFNKIFNSFYLFLIFNFIILIFNVLGDLFISLYKRVRKIKNSGNILPGHGGILDRIDSSLFSFSVFLFIC
jgi:phosphatidate cytidylyltransferase